MLIGLRFRHDNNLLKKEKGGGVLALARKIHIPIAHSQMNKIKIKKIGGLQVVFQLYYTDREEGTAASLCNLFLAYPNI